MNRETAMWLTIFVGLVICFVSLSIVTISFDPNVNRDDYCRQYAIRQDWRMTPKYIVNYDVASKVCECTRTYYNDTCINGTCYPPLYDYATTCRRRGNV